MFEKIRAVIPSCVIVLITMFPVSIVGGPPAADTLPKSDSITPAVSAIVAEDPVGRGRDSQMRALFSALETEASEKAAAAAEQSSRGISRDIIGTIERLPLRVKRYPWIPVAVAALAVIAVGLFMAAARRRAKREARRFMTTTRLSLMNSEVQRACLHIEKNFADPALTPSSLCAAITTGEPFLETLFKRELGIGVAAYISQVRIHRARLVVDRNGEGAIAGIAARVGFTLVDEFEAQFKSVTGVDFADFCREKRAEK